MNDKSSRHDQSDDRAGETAQSKSGEIETKRFDKRSNHLSDAARKAMKAHDIPVEVWWGFDESMRRYFEQMTEHQEYARNPEQAYLESKRTPADREKYINFYRTKSPASAQRVMSYPESVFDDCVARYAESTHTPRDGQSLWERWLLEDDPDRRKKLDALYADCASGKSSWTTDKYSVDATKREKILAQVEHEQSLYRLYGIAQEPKINAPDRLEWHVRNRTTDLVELERRLNYSGTGSIAPETIKKAIGEMNQAHGYAVAIWRSIPGLPDVPDRQPNDPQSWRESLLIWCVKADRAMKPAPAKLPDPTHADKPPKRKAGRPAVRTAAVKQADAKLWRDFQSSAYQTYLDYANARNMPLSDVERRIEAARRDASRAQKSAPKNPVKRK